uniref:TSA: Wollemia nobilis Ref_Wollemi_Transcript_25010_1468 transcribed RNA sequence n=1 Tax=Wollemia nobilis TaxID=56998 RepID=A0A0C9S1P7_9CONI
MWNTSCSYRHYSASASALKTRNFLSARGVGIWNGTIKNCVASFPFGVQSSDTWHRLRRFSSSSLWLKLQSKERRCRKSAELRVRAAVVFKDLDPDDFRHPLDKQNTALLRTFPGLNDFGKILLGPVAEQIMLLENIGTSVLVTKNQLPDLHQIMIEAANILCIEAPDLYVRQNPVPNAYTLTIGGRKPFIVVHTSIVELLTLKELQAVLAHELGHLKCDHGIWLTFANILMLGTYSIPGLGSFIEEQLFRWLRAAELTCDRAALLVVQDPKIVISALMKLAGGCPSLADQLSVDAFLEQARSYDAASSSPVGWYLRNAQTRQLSHPLPVLRAREIDQWARNPQYKALLARAYTAAIGTATSTNNPTPRPTPTSALLIKQS